MILVKKRRLEARTAWSGISVSPSPIETRVATFRSASFKYYDLLHLLPMNGLRMLQHLVVFTYFY